MFGFLLAASIGGQSGLISEELGFDEVGKLNFRCSASSKFNLKKQNLSRSILEFVKNFLFHPKFWLRPSRPGSNWEKELQSARYPRPGFQAEPTTFKMIKTSEKGKSRNAVSRKQALYICKYRTTSVNFDRFLWKKKILPSLNGIKFGKFSSSIALVPKLFNSSDLSGHPTLNERFQPKIQLLSLKAQRARLFQIYRKGRTDSIEYKTSLEEP